MTDSRFSKQEQEIVDLLNGGDVQQLDQIASALWRPPGLVARNLRELRRAGVVHQSEATKGWRLHNQWRTWFAGDGSGEPPELATEVKAEVTVTPEPAFTMTVEADRTVVSDSEPPDTHREGQTDELGTAPHDMPECPVGVVEPTDDELDAIEEELGMGYVDYAEMKRKIVEAELPELPELIPIPLAQVNEPPTIDAEFAALQARAQELRARIDAEIDDKESELIELNSRREALEERIAELKRMRGDG